jgi:hypothetical protein
MGKSRRYSPIRLAAVPPQAGVQAMFGDVGEWLKPTVC